MTDNRQWVLTAKPEGLVGPEHLALRQTPLPEPGAGEVLLKLIYISLDPGQQFYISSTEDVGGGTMKIGDVVRAWAVGRVVASRSDRFPVGSYARDRYGFAGVQDYALLPEAQLAAVDPALTPLSSQIGILGMPGLTAYLGLVEMGKPEAGQTVLVSGASGAVGSSVGQIAKAKGCRVVGLAGGPEKCRSVVERYGFDACIDYRGDDVGAALADACPDGIDIYFDNVAGPLLDVCLPLMASRGRIIYCGASGAGGDYGATAGLANTIFILIRSLRWEGLSIHNFYDRYDHVYESLERLYRDGLLKGHEDVSVGLDTFIPAFHRLFAGSHQGKLVLQVNDGETL